MIEPAPLEWAPPVFQEPIPDTASARAAWLSAVIVAAERALAERRPGIARAILKRAIEVTPKSGGK